MLFREENEYNRKRRTKNMNYKNICLCRLLKIKRSRKEKLSVLVDFFHRYKCFLIEAQK